MLPIPLIVVGVVAGCALAARHIKRNGYPAEAKKISRWMKRAFSDEDDVSLEAGLNRVFDNDRTPLMRAFEMNNADIVKSLLTLDVQTDIRNSRGWTALFFAVQNGDVEQLDLLIKAGVSVNAMDKLGRTALFYTENLACAKSLVEAGALVDAVDNDGRSAMFFSQTEEMIFFLVEHKADVNVIDSFGRTAIYYAPNSEVAHALLVNNAKYNIYDNDGVMPYDFVRDFEKQNSSGIRPMTRAQFDDRSPAIFYQLASWEFIHCVRSDNNLLLKKRIAQWPEIKVGKIVDDNGDPLLRHAIYSNNEQAMIMLIEQEADVNACDSYGDPLIFSTILNNEASQTRILCEAGAVTNVRNAADKTALRVGFFYRNYDILELLVIYGADVNLRDEKGRTPLFYAQNPRLIQAMVDKGADLNATDNDGNSPIFLAESSETIHALARNKADVNFRNNDEETPLFVINKQSLIRALLEEGANVNVKAKGKPLSEVAHGDVIFEEMFQYVTEQIESNNNARLKELLSSKAIVYLVDSYGPLLNQAVKANNIEVAKFLIESGANVDCIDKYHDTPLLIAIKNQSLEFISMLISANVIVHVGEDYSYRHNITFDKSNYYVTDDNPLKIPTTTVECKNNSVVIENRIHERRNVSEIEKTHRDYYDLRSMFSSKTLNGYEKELLSTAIKVGNVEVIRTLFAAGLSTNIMFTTAGETGFSRVIRTGNIALINAFLDAKVFVRQCSEECYDALLNAINKNDAEHFERLIKIDAVNKYMNSIPESQAEILLMAVIQSGNDRILKDVLGRYSKLTGWFKNTINVKNNDYENKMLRETALNFIRQAIRCKHIDVTNTLLLQSPWDVGYVLNDIIDSDMTEIISGCFDHANLNDIQHIIVSDSSYIMRAVKRGNVGMVRIIMERAKLTPNLLVKRGFAQTSLLEFALTSASDDVCKYLIDNSKTEDFDWVELKKVSISPEVKRYIEEKNLSDNRSMP